MGGCAMVAQVQKEEFKVFGEFGGNAEPIIERAEEAVQHNERRALAEGFEVELHLPAIKNEKLKVKNAGGNDN
jgi:hypothetical protein